MTCRTAIFVTAVLACGVAVRAAGAATELPDDDWQADAAAANVRADRVPVVPLPPALYGSASVLGVLALARINRLRKWFTLR